VMPVPVGEEEGFGEVEDEVCAADKVILDSHPDSANARISYSTRVHDGWRVSFRQCTPEQNDVKAFVPRLMKLMSYWGPTVHRLQPPQRSKPVADAKKVQARQRAIKNARQRAEHARSIVVHEPACATPPSLEPLGPSGAPDLSVLDLFSDF
jgi:hypothetical protein